MAWIKRVYLYLVSLISLVIIVVGTIILLNLALRTWVFTKADNNNYVQPPISCAEVKNPEGMAVPAYPNCDNNNYAQQQKDERSSQRQRSASEALAMIIVASPVFYYHWRLARKEV